jgi:hypothetical protein
MLKMTAKLDDRDLLVIGLSFGNLKKFLAQPGNTFIRIKGEEIGLPIDVLIFSGETEAHMTEIMKRFIGPDTKVYVDPKLKS